MFIWAAIVLIAIFVLPILPTTGTVGQFLIGEIIKGARVGDKSSANPTAPSEIDQSPEDLAASAGLDLQTYTLARIISSEEGNSPVLYWVAIAWASKNNAPDGDIFSWATDGSFGEQGSGRPVSTRQDPYEGHVKVAQAVLAGTVADPTEGARYWIAPRTQDILHLRDSSKYKSFADVNASRLASGLRQVNPAGIDSGLLVFYA